jgi:hypothetical protein
LWYPRFLNYYNKDTTTILIITLLIMAVPIKLNMGDITHNDNTYKLLYTKMILIIIDFTKTVNKKHVWTVAYVNVISKVFISIIIVS